MIYPNLIKASQLRRLSLRIKYTSQFEKPLDKIKLIDLIQLILIDTAANDDFDEFERTCLFEIEPNAGKLDFDQGGTIFILNKDFTLSKNNPTFQDEFNDVVDNLRRVGYDMSLMSPQNGVQQVMIKW